jgi:hypothetical protein
MANRRHYRGCFPPDVRLETFDGTPAVVVSLVGAFGRGHTVTLDPEAWEHIRATAGDQLTQDRDHRGRWFVTSLARRDVRVSREVVGPIPPRAAVGYLNGDHRDCRRANLVVLPVTSRAPAARPIGMENQASLRAT